MRPRRLTKGIELYEENRGWMLDILLLRISPDEFDQLRLCQTKAPSDCHAAFTVKGTELIWPLASWGDPPVAERINVRGWFPVLDKVADEFLIFRPRGGCFFVSSDGVTYRLEERDTPGVLFLRFEVKPFIAVPQRQTQTRRAY